MQFVIYFTSKVFIQICNMWNMVTKTMYLMERD